MAKLFGELQNDKLGARSVSKGGDEYLTIHLSNGNMRIFDVTFKDDGGKRGLLEVMSYADGKKQVIEYMKQGTQHSAKCQGSESNAQGEFVCTC